MYECVYVMAERSICFLKIKLGGTFWDSLFTFKLLCSVVFISETLKLPVSGCSGFVLMEYELI